MKDKSKQTFLVWKGGNVSDFELHLKYKFATLDGNSVVLEEEMMKLTQARMDYDAAVGLYQQSLNMLKTAIKKPGS